jgi:hypothetical protein
MTPDSLAEARRQIGAAGTASFSCDIFDTFLLRRCTGPDGVNERGLRARVVGTHFQALEEYPPILVMVPASDQPISIVTMTVGPLPPVAA